MLALVSSELKLHWAKGNLLKTVFFFSGIYTETVWISLGMVRIFLLIIEEKKKKSCLLWCLPPDMFKVEAQLWKLDAFDLCCAL